jgi:cytoskeleton protein RodZ
MARGNFGERLKRERELREVSMEELTKATRISTRFVEALENEDWAKLPGGVFGHGFVRTIARYLGLNEEALLGEYDSARAEQLPAAPPKPEERIPSPPKWLPAAAVLVALLLLAGLFFTVRYAWHRYSAHGAAKKSAAGSLAAEPQPQSAWTLPEPGLPAGETAILCEPAIRGNRRGLLGGVAGIERYGHDTLGAPGASGTMELSQKSLRP